MLLFSVFLPTFILSFVNDFVQGEPNVGHKAVCRLPPPLDVWSGHQEYGGGDSRQHSG